MKGYIFPGQGSQHVGMGKSLYAENEQARKMFERANRMVDIDLTRLMFEGPEEALKETVVAQPAIFICSVAMALLTPTFKPAAVAGHSLGEISALAASQFITFEDGLRLVVARARAMQAACKLHAGGMVAILGLPNEIVEACCTTIATEDLVMAANYNCPGQLVISGSQLGIKRASEALLQAGARKVVPLKVAGGFHTPLMESACKGFAEVVADIPFASGICPIYQNVTGAPTTDPVIIKANLLKQLIAPVYWTDTIQHMVKNGITTFIECGPGNVLQGLTRKIERAHSISNINE